MLTKLIPLKGFDLIDYAIGRPVFNASGNRFTLEEDWDEDLGKFLHVSYNNEQMGIIKLEEYEDYPDKEVHCELDNDSNFLLYMYEPCWETAFICGTANFLEDLETNSPMNIPVEDF